MNIPPSLWHRVSVDLKGQTILLVCSICSWWSSRRIVSRTLHFNSPSEEEGGCDRANTPEATNPSLPPLWSEKKTMILTILGTLLPFSSHQYSFFTNSNLVQVQKLALLSNGQLWPQTNWNKIKKMCIPPPSLKGQKNSTSFMVFRSQQSEQNGPRHENGHE